MTEYFNIVEVPGRLTVVEVPGRLTVVEVPGRLTVVVGMRTRPLMKMML